MEERKPPVRVLMVLTRPCAANGLAMVAKNYCAAFDPGDVTVDLVAPNPLPEGDARALAARGGKSFVLKNRNTRQLGYILRLARIVRAGHYDIVHAHGNSATLYTEMLAAKFGGARVRIAHSHNTGCTYRLLHKLLNRPFQKSCTHAFACGQEAGEWLFPGRPFTVMNNAVDVPAFGFDAALRAKTRAALGYEDGARVFGHVGSFTARKNQSFLLEAFALTHAQSPSARLLLVGGGPEQGAARARAAALGLSDAVCFYGETDNAAPLYSAMDAFCLPSLAEGLPLTLVEAQSAGLPCLASERVTRQADVTGLVSFLPLEKEAWAGAMLALQAQGRASERAKRLAQIAAAGYDIRENAEKVASLYRRLAEEAVCRR